MTKVFYPVSCDPITYGHINIAERVSKIFDHVVVGIGTNPKKEGEYLFTADERFNMAEKSLKHLKNVEVVKFSGTFTDYAYEHKINVVIRGVRDSDDFAYEFDYFLAGKSQIPDIEIITIFSDPALATVRSSFVKNFQLEQGMIQDFVPLYVKQMVEKKLSNQYIFGVTGVSGSGKSYFCKKFIEFGRQYDIDVHDIDLDSIGHDILSNLKLPVYQDVRDKIVAEFGPHILLEDGTIDRSALGEIVFGDKPSLKKLNDIMADPLLVLTRRNMYNKEGLILFNAALIAESNMSYLCNNNVLLINVDKETQIKSLSDNGLSEEQIKRRSDSQYNYKQKKSYFLDAVKRDNCGMIVEFDNSGYASEEKLKLLFEKIISEMGLNSK